MNLNYEKDVTIDEEGLDTEWLSQPRLMLTYGNHAAEKRKEVDIAKEKLDVVKAELDRKIRMEPSFFGLSKLTETVIQNTIIVQTKYTEASENYIEAKYELDMAMAAVRAIDQKKQALENLVKLHGQQYFAGPKVPRDLSQEWLDKQRQKQSDAKVAKAMRRK
jgi:hypothetical protein